MPTKQRKSKARQAIQPCSAEFWDLTLGPHHMRPVFGGPNTAARRAWRASKDRLMASVHNRPGHRPDAWWTFESPKFDIPEDAHSEPDALYRCGAADATERAEIEAVWRRNIAYARLHNPDDPAAARALALEWGKVAPWFFDAPPAPIQ
jgi:hypothetical protein